MASLAPIPSSVDYLAQKPMKMEQFFSSWKLSSPEEKEAVLKVKEAIGCVLTDDQQPNGSALYIGGHFVISPKHCFPQEEGFIYFKAVNRSLKAVTLIDGELDPSPEFRADYKILRLEEVNNLKAPSLSVGIAAGGGLQINYQVDGELYITPYQSQEIGQGYATRSDLASVRTINGDSGGSRFSMLAKAVHAFHQGESEALKVNDLFHSIASLKTNEKKKQLIGPILKVLQENCADIAMLSMDFSTVWLKPGQVIPERHGVLESIRKQPPKPTYPTPDEVFNDIVDFLKKIGGLSKEKNQFYGKIWSGSRNIYTLSTNKKWGTRLDCQKPLKNAANLQFQYKDVTIATVLVSNELAKRSTAAGMAEVVNYVVRKLEEAIIHNKNNQTAIVIAVAPIGKVSAIQ